MSVTIVGLAAELDAVGPGATANAITGYLGHRSYGDDEHLDPADEADVRRAWGERCEDCGAAESLRHEAVSREHAVPLCVDPAVCREHRAQRRMGML